MLAIVGMATSTLVILVIVVLLAFGAVPYGNSRGWGYGPGGGLVGAVLLVLWLLGVLR